MIHQVVHHPFGVAENNAQFEIVDIDEPGEQLDFVTPIHFVKNLLDGWNSERFLLDGDILRGARIFLDQLLNRPGDSGGEKDRLALFRSRLENYLAVVPETHDQHDINLIENNY